MPLLASVTIHDVHESHQNGERGIDTVHIHVSSPLRTSEACLTARETRQTSCCTKCHASAVFRYFASSMASFIPGNDLDS
jgi:hypothetical protein